MNDRRGGASLCVVASLIALSLAGGWPTPALGTIELPPGFVETQLIFLIGPVSIEWAPDGALWIAQGAGQLGMGVYVYRNGLLTQALSLPNTQSGERGIHSLAVDPDYPQNGWIWVYYTADNPPHNRLSRFTNVGDTLQNEVVVVEGPPLASILHNGGCLVFASDGTVFLGMGDDQQGSSTAQDLYDLRGKILHINRDGTPAWDNPFVTGDPRVWALGFRNPYRCALQPGTSNLFIGDVGEGEWEEVDIGVAGGDYGWASAEGPEPAGLPGVVYPIYSYEHDHPVGSSVIGGEHVPAGAFDPSYEGNYFFADWSREEIRRMVLDGNNNPVSTEVWGRLQYRGPTDLTFGPDGNLYYAGEAGAGVYRIAWTGGTNSPPSAVVTVDKDSGSAPLQVQFDATGSSDPDGDILTYILDFGDVTGGVVPKKVTHSYAQGVYEAVLTVQDGRGLQATAGPVRIVSGNERPAAAITDPPSGLPYVAGQEIFFDGRGGDLEEGEIPCSQFTWEVRFHHEGHWHPFLGPIQGICSGSFTTAESGEVSPNTWYEIRLSVSDLGWPVGSSGILTGQDSIPVFPYIARMTFETAPFPDLTLTLDTVPITPPVSVDGVVNFIRWIGVVDWQIRDGHPRRWISWSDGGAIHHQIRIPASDTTFTATFGCVVAEVQGFTIDRALEQFEPLLLNWLPVTDECLTTAPGRYRIYVSPAGVPTVRPGAFPNDPPFTLLATVDTESFVYDIPSAGSEYFLVVAVGSDDRDGASGHYEPTPVAP